MLQQTQAERVAKEYYHKFFKKFPTMQTLARAEQKEILQLWAGLGYYRRAKHLHQAAQQIVANHQGKIPSTKEALMQLPGVGIYTAGAVMAFAYNKPSIVLDTNAKKVFQRVFFYKKKTSEKQLEDFALSLVPKNKAREWYSAVMDFGAGICTARPKCALCPMQKMCSAYPKILQEKKVVKKTIPFTETNRWWRGKVLRILTKENPLTRIALEQKIYEQFGRKQRRKLDRALQELQQETFIQYNACRKEYFLV